MESRLLSRQPTAAVRWVRRAAGFTLIELLVVIGILALLMGALLPLVVGGDTAARNFTCKQNLKKMYDGLTLYQQKYKSFPTQPGPKFLLSLWTREVLEHTDTSRDLFFCPGVSDPHVAELRKVPMNELWSRLDDVTNEDTHYAGRNTMDKSLSKTLLSGKECLAADDNESGSNHSDGSVNYLMGDGRVDNALKVVLQEEGLMTREETFIPVGPESPVPYLKHVIAR